jgi:hypothetical protein
MKTPREIILARHQAATPKLDDIRHAVVGKLNNEATKEQKSQNIFVSLLLSCSKDIWRELILPSRRIWTGLAAVWVIILAANFSMRDHAPITMAKSPSPEMISTFQQQEQLLSELIGPDETSIAEPQKTFVPRPASERFPEILVT